MFLKPDYKKNYSNYKKFKSWEQILLKYPNEWEHRDISAMMFMATEYVIAKYWKKSKS